MVELLWTVVMGSNRQVDGLADVIILLKIWAFQVFGDWLTFEEFQGTLVQRWPYYSAWEVAACSGISTVE